MDGWDFGLAAWILFIFFGVQIGGMREARGKRLYDDLVSCVVYSDRVFIVIRDVSNGDIGKIIIANVKDPFRNLRG